MNTYWLCFSLSICFRSSLAQNGQRNFSVVEFKENLKSLAKEFVNEEKSSEENQIFENYVVSLAQDFATGLVLGPISFKEAVLGMIGQLVEEKIKDDPLKIPRVWAAIIASEREDSGIELEQDGENIGEEEMEMSSPDPKVEEKKKPLLSLFSRRTNEQSFSRISRSVTEEANTKAPLTEDRKSFLLKFKLNLNKRMFEI